MPPSTSLHSYSRICVLSARHGGNVNILSIKAYYFSGGNISLREEHKLIRSFKHRICATFSVVERFPIFFFFLKLACTSEINLNY